MLKRLGRFLNKILHPLGYTLAHVHKIVPRSAEKNWIEKLKIETVIDIGSNQGQFIIQCNEIAPGRRYYAFEPISSCYKQLLENTKNINVTAYNLGLSDQQGEVEINISNNVESSSILPMEDLHKESYPESRFVKKEIVSLARLDEILATDDIKKNILIKMDVQGYEKNVIKGGERILVAASALLIESAFEPFYKEQWLFDDLYTYFNEKGFKFMGFTDQFNSPKTGIPLYADSIFIKKEMVSLIL
jgi:FkbM family methyltransferase